MKTTLNQHYEGFFMYGDQEPHCWSGPGTSADRVREMAAYGLRKMPHPKALALFGERWSPHRSAAAWYLWRACELHRAGTLPVPKERTRLPRLAKRAAPRVSKRAPPLRRAGPKRLRRSR